MNKLNILVIGGILVVGVAVIVLSSRVISRYGSVPTTVDRRAQNNATEGWCATDEPCGTQNGDDVGSFLIDTRPPENTESPGTTFNAVLKQQWEFADSAEELLRGQDETLSASVVANPDNADVFFISSVSTTDAERPMRSLYFYDARANAVKLIDRVRNDKDYHVYFYLLGYDRGRLVYREIGEGFVPTPCDNPWLVSERTVDTEMIVRTAVGPLLASDLTQEDDPQPYEPPSEVLVTQGTIVENCIANVLKRS